MKRQERIYRDNLEAGIEAMANELETLRRLRTAFERYSNLRSAGEAIGNTNTPEANQAYIDTLVALAAIPPTEKED